MEKLENEQTELLSQTAEAEKQREEKTGERKSEVSLGKFKDVDALLSAYGSLEAEFTKRCQRIKELESALNLPKEKALPPEEMQATKEQPSKEISKEEREEIVKEYLFSVLGRKQSAIVMDGNGVGVKAPKERPKTIREAGLLARELFKK
jgi:hypothetical protein